MTTTTVTQSRRECIMQALSAASADAHEPISDRLLIIMTRRVELALTEED